MRYCCDYGMKMINKYIIFQLMKQQRATRQRRQASQGLPAIENNGINQTIIINNPNFNINYIDHNAYNKPNSRKTNSRTIQELPLYDPKNSSKGIDAWNLNKNLKQFSETRQLGFFKGNNSKTKSNSDLQNSPYLSHKTKTQQIKPYTKIRPSNTLQPTSFRQNKTIPTIKHEVMLITQRDRSALSNNLPSTSTIDVNDQSKTTFRKRKFESRNKNGRVGVSDLGEDRDRDREEVDVAETLNSGAQTQRKISPIALATRRNRFIELDKAVLKQAIKKQQNQQQADISDLQNSLIIETSPTKLKNPINPAPKTRSKAYQRSIQKISKNFLSQVDNYFNNQNYNSLPSSKIQLYTTTVHQPVSYSYNIDYKSTLNNTNNTVQNMYDFQFDEEKLKARPKTPYKRKKMYEEII